MLVHANESYNVSKGSDLNITVTVYSLPTLTENGVSFTNGDNSVIVRKTVSSVTIQLDVFDKSVNRPGQTVTIHLMEVPEEYFTMFTIAMDNSAGVLQTNVSLFPKGLYKTMD